MDGWTAARIETELGVPGFLDDLRAALKDGSFWPLPVRERLIPKPGGSGKLRKLWRWTDVRRRFTTPTGQWLPVTAGEIELTRIAAIPITQYRYRGGKIPTPWVPHYS